ncbi:hypothetical protein [Burkholderia ubonensis]|uniref:hypothetical protein n=1 Tax=Burkholderia ubonensis TaxID=101571 RepID=UPI0012FA434B|nr:hypothetical protein [Burkholderia ubonensis]
MSDSKVAGVVKLKNRPISRWPPAERTDPRRVLSGRSGRMPPARHATRRPRLRVSFLKHSGGAVGG